MRAWVLLFSLIFFGTYLNVEESRYRRMRIGIYVYPYKNAKKRTQGSHKGHFSEELLALFFYFYAYFLGFYGFLGPPAYIYLLVRR